MGADNGSAPDNGATMDDGRGGGGAFALGAMFGAALGAAVGLLWAPRSGSETRAKLREKSEETADTLKAKSEELAVVAREKGEAARASVEARMSDNGDEEAIVADQDYLNQATDWGSGP